MLKGVYLTLMVGPAVPAPVPQTVLDALTDVTVTNSDDENGFQLTFTLNNRSPLHTLFLLSGGNAIPLMRVILVVTLNSTPDVLMDGIVTHTEISPGQDSRSSMLTVIGKDLSQVMDYQLFSNPPGTPYPAMPAEARVALLLAKYAVFGIVPLVIPSIVVDVPIPTDRIPTQQGTDLEYIRHLAEQVGYVFHVNPGPTPGTSTAYWGPAFKTSAPQPALSINMDAFTNVDSLSFTFDSEATRLPILLVQNKETKALIPIPLPDITPLNPPFGLIPPIPKVADWMEGIAKLSPTEAIATALSAASRSADAVSCSGGLDVQRYGRLLKARRSVTVRGAGPAFDGLYYVKSVTSKIKRGEYRQDFTLSRNGLVSTVSRVPV
jgi:hypothetical protein